MEDGFTGRLLPSDYVLAPVRPPTILIPAQKWPFSTRIGGHFEPESLAGLGRICSSANALCTSWGTRIEETSEAWVARELAGDEFKNGIEVSSKTTKS